MQLVGTCESVLLQIKLTIFKPFVFSLASILPSAAIIPPITSRIQFHRYEIKVKYWSTILNYFKDNLSTVSVIQFNAKQMDLLDASSGMFMMGLKVSPNYCKLWEWLYTPVLGGQLIWKSSVTYVIWYGYHSWKRQALMDRNNCCYQLSGLTIEFKKTHDS